MKIKQLQETTAGSVASVAMPIGTTHKRTEEAANPAQQAAIAIAMKKAGKKPKNVKEGFSKDEIEAAMKDFIKSGGEVVQGKKGKGPRKSGLSLASKHIGGGGDKMRPSRTGRGSKPIGKAVVAVESNDSYTEINPKSFLDDDFYAFDPETKVLKGTWSHKSVGRRHHEYEAKQKGYEVVSGMKAKHLGLLKKTKIDEYMQPDSGATPPKTPTEKPVDTKPHEEPKDKKDPKSYMTKESSIFKGVSEAHISEEELLLAPGQGVKFKTELMPKRTDHEVEMARNQLRVAAQSAKRIYQNIKDLSEIQGLDGWVQAKITKASDYLDAVNNYIEGKKQMLEIQSEVDEQVAGDAIDQRLTAQYNTPQAKAQSQTIDQAFASGDEQEFQRLGIQSPQQIERDYQAMLAREPAQDAAVYANPKLTPSARRPVQRYNPKGVPVREFDDRSPTSTYVQSRSTLVNRDGDENFSKRIATLATDKHGNQRVRALDTSRDFGDEVTINTNIPRGVTAKIIPQQGDANIEETKRLSTREKFKRSLKRAGYDPDAGADRLLNLIARQAEERKEFERKQKEQDAEFYGKKEGVAEAEGQPLSVQQLAMISDEALDNAYGYGRSSPGNTFGWQANLMSAAYAKKMIDAGVTDIEKIADAIHKGWNVTAQKFVQDPDQFDDTEKLRQAGKLDAKLAQRAKLMRIGYFELDNDEQEKDRVVARALLQAIKGEQGVAEGLKFHGGFPDVDHMRGAVHRDADMITDNVKTNNKKDWDRAVDSINARVFDDMSDFYSDSKGERVVGNSAVWAKWDNETQTGWFNAKGRPLKPWPVKEQGVAEDWQKTNRRDKTSGMSRKAVKQYRRENPGSKLQTAVTTKPSKLKKGSKSAKRRKSFCSRMRGMKKSRTSAKTARDPNSNINKALRRWNCESVEDMRNLVLLAEQKIAMIREEESLEENLHKWFKEKWVRFGPDGKIRGDCARGDDSEGKPKCLPQSKAHALGKKGRASAGARKRREDPNPERSGPAINVATKKKANEDSNQPNPDAKKNIKSAEEIIRALRPDLPPDYEIKVRDKDSKKPPVGGKEQLRKDIKDAGKEVYQDDFYKESVAEGFERFQVGDKISFPLSQMATGIVDKIDDKRLYVKLDNGEVYTIPSTMLHSVKLLERQGVAEGHEMCPECGGAMYSEEMINEKKDACYYKVKSRYKVWPSAYASGALVKCRNKGAKNWGNKSK